MREQARRFRGDILQRAIAVHGLQQPALGLASFGEDRNKVLLALLQQRLRKETAEKSGLQETHFFAAVAGGNGGLPAPDIIIADEVRAQAD